MADMLATKTGGQFNDLQDCYIRIGDFKMYMYNMPDISDSHNATYNTQNGTGRSLPTYTFSYGGDRTISWTIHFYADSQKRLLWNLDMLRLLESLTYPRTETRSMPFVPPQIVKLKCGEVLGSYEICAIVESYSVKFPVDVPWSLPGYLNQGKSYIPYKFDVDLSMKAVYDSGTLPGSERIITDGN